MMTWKLHLLPAVLILCLGGSPAHAAPLQVRTLESFGAKGDGRTDDRIPLTNAFREGDKYLLDGENRTYAVRGTIDVANSLTLRRAKFVQTLPPLDMSKYIRSADNPEFPGLPPDQLRSLIPGHPWLSAGAVVSYPEDPVLEGADLQAVTEITGVRTLYIHGTLEKPVSVQLSDLVVHRGTSPQLGSRSDSAGIYLAFCDPINVENVEITGDGRGSPLHVSYSGNVELKGLNIHDATWAPYQGEAPFEAASVKNNYLWNNREIYEFSGKLRKFVRVRVQEQVAGLMIVKSRDVSITDSKISRMQALFTTGPLPWQADGMTIGDVENLTILNCSIDTVWEGVDLTGQGVRNFLMRNVRISETMAYGFKFCHPVQNGRVLSCTSENAGMSGFIFGPGAHDITLEDCSSEGTGKSGYWLGRDRGMGTIAAYRIMGAGKDPEGEPHGIKMIRCRSLNTERPRATEYGFLCDSTCSAPDFHNTLVEPQPNGDQIKGYQ